MSKFVTLHGFGGSGSSELNFEVVGGTTQPENPKENTIWVNTNTPISSYHFSVSAPFTMTIIENAGTVLGTINGRTFSKTANGKAAFAMVYNGIYSGPMLVSPSIEACSYSTSDGYVGTANTPSSVEYNGTTYYYHGDYWYDGDNTGNFPYVVKGSSNEEIAKILAAFYENPIGIEGMVWISTYSSSPADFNALKNNDSIKVYPVSAKQYVNGGWVYVDAMIYQNEKWVEWFYYLYNSGNECSDQTAGWSSVNGTLTKNSNNFILSNVGASTSTYAAVYTNAMMDLTGYETLHAIARGYYTSGAGYSTFMVVSKTKTTRKSDVTAIIDIQENLGEYVLNVSSLSGTYYIGFMVSGSSSVKDIEVQKVWRRS